MLLSRLFYGKIRQRLSLPPSRSKSSLHEREDYFSHLPVNVSEESFDLYDGLSGYFDDVVEFEGTKAKMEVSLVELPPILQIQLQVGTFVLNIYELLNSYWLAASAIQSRHLTAIQISCIRQVW